MAILYLWLRRASSASWPPRAACTAWQLMAAAYVWEEERRFAWREGLQLCGCCSQAATIQARLL